MLFPLPPLLEGPAKGAPEDGSDEESKKSAHEPRSDLLEFIHAARVGTEGHPHPETGDGPQEGSHKDEDSHDPWCLDGLPVLVLPRPLVPVPGPYVKVLLSFKRLDHPSHGHPKEAHEDDNEQRDDDYLGTHVLTPFSEGALSPDVGSVRPPMRTITHDPAVLLAARRHAAQRNVVSLIGEAVAATLSSPSAAAWGARAARRAALP